MRKSLVSVTLLALTLTPSPGRAEQSVEDRAFAAALEARLKALDLERQNCGRAHSAAAQDRFETIDRVQRASRATPQGGHTIGEKARLEETKQDLESAIGGNYDCIKSVESERASIKATLSNPARLRSERERLRNELRGELLALLTDVRSASAILATQSSYDEFALKMDAVGNRLQSIRTKYAIPLARGDHKALGVPISDACNALYAVAVDWKQVRQATQEVASTQAAVARAAAWEVDFFHRQFRAAQLKHAEAQKRFADHKGIAVAMVQGATSVAQGETKREQAAAASK